MSSSAAAKINHFDFRPHAWWSATVLVATVCVLIGAGVAVAPVQTVIVLGVISALIAIFTLPVDTLPLLALCCFALIPVNDLPLPSAFRGASLGVAVFAVWLLRRSQRPQRPFARATRLSGYLLVCYLLFTTAFTISLARSAVWTFAFIASVLVPVFVGGFTDREANRVIKGLIVLAAGLSCFAIVEYMLHSNPILGHLYTEAPFPVIEHWKTYRVTTTLGHPLYNAMFFAAAAAAAFAVYFETRRTGYLGAFILILIGLFLTGSRGALYLTPAVIVFIIIFQIKAKGLAVGNFGRLALLVGVGLSIAGFLYTQTVGARASTGEAQSSTSARYRDVGVSLSAAGRSHFLGSGPGTSNSAKNESAESVSTNSLVIENSYLQLLVSIGIPGLLLVIVLFGSVVREGVRRSRLPAAGAFLSAVLVISTFNFAEGDRPGLILLGLLAGCCLARPASASPLTKASSSSAQSASCDSADTQVALPAPQVAASYSPSPARGAL